MSVFVGLSQAYTLTVESTEVGALGSAYRLYVNSNDPTDKFSAVFGNDQDTLSIVTPDGIYNDAFNSSWNASGINALLFGVFPDLQYDSYATIGLDGPATNTPGAEDPSLVQDAGLTTTVTDYFQVGGTGLEVNTLTGASWYVLNTAGNALPDEDGRWLIAQVTTTGSISGRVNFTVLPFGDESASVNTSRDFSGVGTFAADGEIILGCTSIQACNYDALATEDDGSCEGLCGCTDDTACNYNPNATQDNDSCVFSDLCGVCGGDNSCLGCTNVHACNFDASATLDDGGCEYPVTGFDCLGFCVSDSDGDGLCDSIPGCLDALSCNFNPAAIVDDGSCEYCSCPNLTAPGCHDADALNYGVSNPMGCLFLSARIDALGSSMGFQHVHDTLVQSWVDYGCGGFSNDDLNMRLWLWGAADFETEPDPVQIVIYSQGQEFVQLGSLENWLINHWYDNDEGDTYEYLVSFDAVSYPDSIGFFFDPCSPTIVKVSEQTPYFEDVSLEVVSNTHMTFEDYPYQDTISLKLVLGPATMSLELFQVSELSVQQFLTSESGGSYNSYWVPPNTLGELGLDSLGNGVYTFQMLYEFDSPWWQDYDPCSPLLVHRVTLPNCSAGILAETTVELDISKIGCGDPEACNYDYFPCGHVGECDYESCAGCGDPYASNFSFAFVDDGSCEYPWEGCVGSSALTGHPMLSSLFYNYDEEAYPISWLTEIQPFFVLSDSNWSNWGSFNEQEQLWLSNVWEDGGGWNAFYEGSLSMPYNQSFDPGSPTVLPFDSLAVGEGVLEDESIVMCVPKFLAEPLSGLPFGLSSLELDSVVGMPPGLSLEFSDSLYSSLSAACIPIVGEAQETGCFPITILGQATVTLFGQPIAFNDLEVDYKICVGDLSGSTESTCQDSTACNFGELGLDCLFLDECGECGGSGIEEGGCDCEGNVLDALGVCGGDCSGDEDNDGICDDVDDCIGELDSCGICGGDNTACMGCTYHEATNFNQASVVDDGSCVFDSGDSCQGDLNDDNVIGIDDILLMLSVYDTTCPQ